MNPNVENKVEIKKVTLTPEQVAANIAKNTGKAPAKVQPKPKAKTKSKPEPKPKAKKVEKPKAAKPKKTPKAKVVGPAMKKLASKLRPKEQGKCDWKGCPAKTGKKYRCLKHMKVVRKLQLAANNVVWRKRVKAGTAGHHAVYTSPLQKKQRLTQWAKKETPKAEAQVKEGASIVDLSTFRELRRKELDLQRKQKARDSKKASKK